MRIIRLPGECVGFDDRELQQLFLGSERIAKFGDEIVFRLPDLLHEFRAQILANPLEGFIGR